MLFILLLFITIFLQVEDIIPYGPDDIADKTRSIIRGCLERLDIGYIDLLMIHDTFELTDFLPVLTGEIFIVHVPTFPIALLTTVSPRPASL